MFFSKSLFFSERLMAMILLGPSMPLLTDLDICYALIDMIVLSASEEVVCRYSSKYVFLEILQISQENLKACDFIKKRLQNRCFPLKFVKFLRAPIFTEHLRRLLLLHVQFESNNLSVLDQHGSELFWL